MLHGGVGNREILAVLTSSALFLVGLLTALLIG